MVENGRQQAIRIAKELCNLYLGNIDLIQIDAVRKGDTVLSNAAEKTAEHITQQMQKIRHTTDYAEIQKMIHNIVNVDIYNLNVLVLQRSYALSQKRENATRELFQIWQLYNEVKKQVGLLEIVNPKFQDLRLSNHLDKKFLGLEQQIHQIRTDTDLSVLEKQAANFKHSLLAIKGDIKKILDKQQKMPDKIPQEKKTAHPFWQSKEQQPLLSENPSKTSRLRK